MRRSQGWGTDFGISKAESGRINIGEKYNSLRRAAGSHKLLFYLEKYMGDEEEI